MLQGKCRHTHNTMNTAKESVYRVCDKGGHQLQLVRARMTVSGVFISQQPPAQSALVAAARV